MASDFLIKIVLIIGQLFIFTILLIFVLPMTIVVIDKDQRFMKRIKKIRVLGYNKIDLILLHDISGVHHVVDSRVTRHGAQVERGGSLFIDFQEFKKAIKIYEATTGDDLNIIESRVRKYLGLELKLTKKPASLVKETASIKNESEITENEKEAITKLEGTLGESLHQIEEDVTNPNKTGYIVKDSHVTGIILSGPGIPNKNNVINAKMLLDFPHITQLGLLACDLNEVPSYIIKMQYLKHLDLYGNRISTLSVDFGGLNAIESLDLSENEIVELPRSLIHLNHLEMLDVSSNKLTTMPDFIGDLKSIKYLYLEENQLTLIPRTIGNLEELEALFLKGNLISKLPDTIGHLKSLKILDLSNNQLSDIPETIGQLRSLTTLDLNNNQLHDIPNTIGQLVSLTKLYLGVNQLQNLPESLGNLRDLQKLRIDNNKLTSIPETMTELTTLQEFFLDGNDLSKVSKLMAAWLKNMKNASIRRQLARDIN